LDDFQAGTLSILFTSLSIGIDNFVVEFTDGLLKLAVALRSRVVYVLA
jgi:putative Mn2+ efflux pump MntP